MKFKILLSFMALALLSFHLAVAAPVVSPLAVTKDSRGSELQQTMVWASEDQTQSSFVAFRKKFEVHATPKSATLHLFADARYLLWINGEPVLRGPARFESRGPEYDSVDITRWLKAGENQVTVLVMGNGNNVKSINNGMGQGHNARMMSHAPGMTLMIEVDGQTVLKTDGTWKWSDQTRYRNGVIDWAQIKDRIDATVEDGEWMLPGYDDSKWKETAKVDGDLWGPLSARRIPLLRDTVLKPELSGGLSFPITLSAGQKLEFQMGRLVQAYTVIELEADAGTEITLNYAGIEYIAKAGHQTYISSDSFAFDGGAITVKSGRATILGFQLVERLYPFDVVGSFKSNDELLNRLWQVCARSLQILSEDAYVDCADRERAEWMDCDPPDFDITRTAMAGPGKDGKPLYADARLLGEMVRRTALTLQKEGWVKAHTCSDRFDIHAKMEDRGCDWVEGARRYYDSCGDAALIREIWPVIVRQMDYFLERRTERGLVLAREWVVWGNPVGYVTCEGAGLNAFVYKALVDAAYLGDAIGEKRDAVRLAQAAKELSEAYNKVLWDEQAGTYYSGYYSEADRAKADGRAKGMKLKVENNLIEPTMFPALWALDQGIVPEDRRARVTDYLFKNRQQANRIMTFYYLNIQMYQADNDAFDSEILGIFRSKWKGQADSKWGTTWEEFNGGSKAHCYGMFPGYFLSAYVLGVRLDGPASNKRLLIDPRLGDLTSAEGKVVTEFGLVPVSWKRDSDHLDFEFQVPEGVTASLRLPAFAGKAVLILDNETVGPAVAGEAKFKVQVKSGVHQGKLTFPAGSFNSVRSDNERNFHDDFIKENSLWLPSSGTWKTESGIYSQTDASVQAVSGLKDLTWSDATYSFSLSLQGKGDGSNWAGFQFRKPSPGASHDQGGYLVYLRANGSLELFNGHVLKSVQTNVNTSKPARLKVVAHDDHLQVYLNDESQPRIDVSDSTFTDGYIGFTSQNLKADFGPLSVTINPAK